MVWHELWHTHLQWGKMPATAIAPKWFLVDLAGLALVAKRTSTNRFLAGHLSARALSLSVTLFGSLGFYIVCAFYIAKIYMMFACCCCLLGCSCRIYSNMVDGCTLYCIIV